VKSIEAILADPAETAAAIEASQKLLQQAMDLQAAGKVLRFYPVVYLDNMQIIERIELVFEKNDELIAERMGVSL
jgi:hypothetical protein